MLEENNTLINDNKKSNNCMSHMPCMKFCVMAIVTLGSFAFGCTMIATTGGTSPLLPFYTSLITSSVAFWCPSPTPYPQDK
jgi:hypothetical protein